MLKKEVIRTSISKFDKDGKVIETKEEVIEREYEVQPSVMYNPADVIFGPGSTQPYWTTLEYKLDHQIKPTFGTEVIK